MRQQRLSRLQRWIILRIYENSVERKRRYNLDDGHVTKYEIYSEYYRLPVRKGKSGSVKAFFTEDPKHIPVDLSRSLHNLFRKGLISSQRFYKNEFVDVEYKGEKYRRNRPQQFHRIFLSPEGEDKAKELLASPQENPN